MLKYFISAVVEPATEQAWMVDTRANPARFLLGIRRFALACQLSSVEVFFTRKDH